MASTSQTYVTGLFPDRASAERAYESAHARGYDVGDVNMAMGDETRNRHFGAASEATEPGTKAGQGAGIGGAIGGTVGAVAAAIAAVGTSLVLPGLGLVVAGPIAAALAGAGAGGPLAASWARSSAGACRKSASSSMTRVSSRAAS